MHQPRTLVVALLALALVGCGGSASSPAKSEKKELTHKDRIVGTWELVKAEGGMAPGATMEFTKDGKIKMTAKMGDKVETLEGTYSVDGDKLLTTSKMQVKKSGGAMEEIEQKETITIKKLTDTEFAGVDERGKAAEFKKK